MSNPLQIRTPLSKLALLYLLFGALFHISMFSFGSALKSQSSAVTIPKAPKSAWPSKADRVTVVVEVCNCHCDCRVFELTVPSSVATLDSIADMYMYLCSQIPVMAKYRIDIMERDQNGQLKIGVYYIDDDDEHALHAWASKIAPGMQWHKASSLKSLKSLRNAAPLDDPNIKALTISGHKCAGKEELNSPRNMADYLYPSKESVAANLPVNSDEYKAYVQQVIEQGKAAFHNQSGKRDPSKVFVVNSPSGREETVYFEQLPTIFKIQNTQPAVAGPSSTQPPVASETEYSELIAKTIKQGRSAYKAHVAANDVDPSKVFVVQKWNGKDVKVYFDTLPEIFMVTKKPGIKGPDDAVATTQLRDVDVSFVADYSDEYSAKTKANIARARSMSKIYEQFGPVIPVSEMSALSQNPEFEQYIKATAMAHRYYPEDPIKFGHQLFDKGQKGDSADSGRIVMLPIESAWMIGDEPEGITSVHERWLEIRRQWQAKGKKPSIKDIHAAWAEMIEEYDDKLDVYAAATNLNGKGGSGVFVEFNNRRVPLSDTAFDWFVRVGVVKYGEIIEARGNEIHMKYDIYPPPSQYAYMPMEAKKRLYYRAVLAGRMYYDVLKAVNPNKLTPSSVFTAFTQKKTVEHLHFKPDNIPACFVRNGQQLSPRDIVDNLSSASKFIVQSLAPVKLTTRGPSNDMGDQLVQNLAALKM